MYERLLVAVDYSEPSQRAVRAACELARLSGGEALVLSVTERQLLKGSDSSAADSEEEEDARELLHQEVAVFEDAGVRASAQVRSVHVGRVAFHIVETAKEFGSDVIVMGSRGRSEFAALLLGSVTYKVLHMAEQPVLVVH
jgi:nucleotide-binding universal stress UspA family protein